MKRTISQLVYDLLDREGILPATEIAKRLGIIRGTACSARDRWKKSRKTARRGPRIVDVNVPSAQRLAPAEVIIELLKLKGILLDMFSLIRGLDTHWEASQGLCSCTRCQAYKDILDKIAFLK